MSLWRAISYRLFAGRGRPGNSLRVRGACFAAALVLASVLIYRLTPRFTPTYASGQTFALVCCLGYGGILMLGMITDSQQRAFLAKLTPVIQQLPLQRQQVRLAYLYASLPIGMAGCIALGVALGAAFANALVPAALWLAVIFSLLGALFCDALLRITNVSNMKAYGIRAVMVTGALYVSHLLLGADDSSAIRTPVLAVLYAALQLVVAAWLVRRPISGAFTQSHMPIFEGHVSQNSALGVRALRTVRYIGSNAVLLMPVAGAAVLANMATPLLPLDSAVLLTMLLTGTLGQEARALSRTHFPIDLVLYGYVRPWAVASWLVGYINALVWIDICLAIVLVCSPYDLSVSVMQAGCTGFAMVSLGTLAGHLVVPARNDILAQCASAVLYGVLVWGLFKFLASAAADHLYPMVWAIGICAACLATAYVWERGRWLKDIRRKHATI